MKKGIIGHAILSFWYSSLAQLAMVLSPQWGVVGFKLSYCCIQRMTKCRSTKTNNELSKLLSYEFPR